MKQMILETIIGMTNDRIAAKRFPYHVLFIELVNKFKDRTKLAQAIRELIKERKIKAGHTINDRYLKPITLETMKTPEKIKNHEIWYKCDCCGFQFDLRITCTCPKCKTHKSESYGI